MKAEIENGQAIVHAVLRAASAGDVEGGALSDAARAGEGDVAGHAAILPGRYCVVNIIRV